MLEVMQTGELKKPRKRALRPKTKPINLQQWEVSRFLQQKKTELRLPMKMRPQDIERLYPKGRFPSPKHSVGHTLWAREQHVVTEEGDFVGYVADYPSDVRINGKLRSASLMPKELSRIDLKVRDIVPERLWKEINRERSFEAEGFIETKHTCDGCVLCDPVLWASSWWNSKYPNADWNSNPYVFVYKLDVLIRGRK